VASAATRDPPKRHRAKTIEDGAGSHFVVKVLQPDGSLKEQSFSSTPSH
jgi:hypothetical protein